MGALHEGHASLMRKARTLAGTSGTVAVSIFVNPSQFGPKEDLSRYPRPFAEDRALCERLGVDLLFAPAAEAMDPADPSVWVDEVALSRGLCGASRPGHFRGVCTVVAKLFHLLGPEIAVFGKKDAQQLAIIRRMVRDLHFPVRIVGVETCREPDGLAMSSRNRYLSSEERAQAPLLHRALREAKARLASGLSPRQPRQAAAALVRTARAGIQCAPLARIDYLEAVDAENLAPATPTTRKLLLAAAVFFGKTRLIDNLEITLRNLPQR
jgi:pantoate--beta-alanine ligase